MQVAKPGVDRVDTIFHDSSFPVGKWSCQPLQVYYTKDSPRAQGCGETQKGSTKKMPPFNLAPLLVTVARSPARINPFRSMIAPYLPRAPGTGGASQAAVGSGCHSSADKATTLRSFPSAILIFIYTAFCGLPASFRVRPLCDKLTGASLWDAPVLFISPVSSAPPDRYTTDSTSRPER